MDGNAQIKRLTLWNRFWLALFALGALAGGCKYLESHIIAGATRLQLRWSSSDGANDGASDGASDGALILSSVGGPFVVTHLAAYPVAPGARSGGAAGEVGEVNMALAAIARLPQPLLVRPKSAVFVSSAELSKLAWLDPDGKKSAAPRPGDHVQALFYEARKVAVDR